jgi:predicted porin
MMKKNGLLLCMLALASSTAFAQSSVTLYGIIDTGVEYVSHANANGDSVIRMPGITGEYPSDFAEVKISVAATRPNSFWKAASTRAQAISARADASLDGRRGPD